jgi:Golgi phosphoprotein 3
MGSTGTATPTSAAAGGSGGSGAVEGRGKIAFDPRDYENGSMGSEYERMPRLTIMEEVLLLGLKDKQVSSRCDRGTREEIVVR